MSNTQFTQTTIGQGLKVKIPIPTDVPEPDTVIAEGVRKVPETYDTCSGRAPPLCYCGTLCIFHHVPNGTKYNNHQPMDIFKCPKGQFSATLPGEKNAEYFDVPGNCGYVQFGIDGSGKYKPKPAPDNLLPPPLRKIKRAIAKREREEDDEDLNPSRKIARTDEEFTELELRLEAFAIRLESVETRIKSLIKKHIQPTMKRVDSIEKAVDALCGEQDDEIGSDTDDFEI